MKKIFLGIGFSESLKTSKRYPWSKAKSISQGSLDSSQLLTPVTHDEIDPIRVSSWRTVPVFVVAFLAMCLIISRLYQLQILKGANYREQSDANRLVLNTQHAPRGIIYDRNHVPLVKNLPAFVKIEGNTATLIPYDEALAIEATQSATAVEVQAIRSYPEKDILAHILGYTSEISKEELSADQFTHNYAIGDRVGRAGLELSYENYLHGVDGAVYTEVNATRNTKRQVATTEPVQGKSLVLGIDMGLQREAYQDLSAALTKLHLPSGVVIAQVPKTGEILALVSIPSYDNNVFSGNLSQVQYTALVNDPNRPLYDRAIAGQYPPGSIFKIITSTAGFMSGKLNASTQITDTGVITIGPFSFPNWLWLSQHRTEGVLDIVRAIARSNDIFFYQVGSWVGPDGIAQAARKLGMGKATGIDLPGEVNGVVPDPNWKKRVQNQIWYPGDTYHMAIGQGDNLETPMQLNMLTAYIANYGTAQTPHLVTQILDADGHVEKTIEPKTALSTVINHDQLNLIRQGMQEACATGGTGWPFFDFGVRQASPSAEATTSAQASSSGQPVNKIAVGCKTGTAEIGDQKPEAWFTVFAPYDNPQIALTILIENGGEGSDVSGPVAKQILQYYFEHHKE